MVNPLFRLGHVQVRKVLHITRGYPFRGSQLGSEVGNQSLKFLDPRRFSATRGTEQWRPEEWGKHFGESTPGYIPSGYVKIAIENGHL